MPTFPPILWVRYKKFVIFDKHILESIGLQDRHAVGLTVGD